MNSKDRVLTAINHECPDRIPRHSGFTPEIVRDLKSIFNFSDERYAIDFFFNHDILWYEIGMGTVWDLPYKTEVKFNKEGIYYDEYRIGWKKANYKGGFYIDMVDHPLKDSIDNIENLKLPDIPKSQFDGLKELVKKYGKKIAIIGGISSTVFEAAWYLRGQQQLLIDLLENPEVVDILMEKVTDYHLKIAQEMVGIGVDLIFLGDDVGAQDRPIISRKMIHKFLTPKYARIVKELKKINPNIKFAFHCCGNVYHVLPELIEAEIDILQVIQPGSVDFSYIKKKYGRNISFWGGIDVQQLIPNGTIKQVVSNVKSAIEILGKNGGYIIGMSHNVQPGPRAIENVITAYHTIEKFGCYR